MSKPERPFLVTLLAESVLILSAYHMVRFGTALTQWNLLADLAPLPGPLYIAVTGLFWTLILLAVALNLWFGWMWVSLTTQIAILLYGIYYWFDRLVFQSAQPRMNWLFSLVVLILYLFFTALALGLPGSRKFFHR